ncbi:MBL fold metallo-hydrolase [uncultured Bacteroides sp.]|uniref:MBL fold metallo-hydrolase n=1 Tax=uncultured Bacteroides sp. TaxID=162156 RepID=UPI002AABD247|nr:MBL fold metallo-hydrolase [uncultured Bacteroides sp.]
MKLKYLMLMLAMLSTGFASAGSFDTDTFKTKSNKDVIITFIKHGSLMLTYNKQSIQIDPVSEYADYSAFPKADAILITHEHGDHLDQKAISILTKKGTSIVINESAQKKLGKGTVMKNGDKIKILGHITVEAVPAYNTTSGREMFHPRHRDNGYLLVIDGLRIYIAGDTEDIPEMKELKNIDVAFLPVNQPYTMTVPQAVHAAKMFMPKVLYPYHFGNTDVNKIKIELKGSSIDVRIRKME